MSQNNRVVNAPNIDIYKLILTCFVCIMYYEGAYFNTGDAPSFVFEGAYLAVDFFFCLSGFLLFRSQQSKKYDSCFSYTANKVQTFFWGNCIVILLVIFLEALLSICANASLLLVAKSSVKMLLNSLFDFVFLQMFLPSYKLNAPAWYISVMLIVGMVYFSILERRSKQNSIYAYFFAAAALIYLLLFEVYQTIDLQTAVAARQEIFCKINPGIFRGMAGMGLGICCGAFVERYQFRFVTFNRIVLLCMMGAIMFFAPHSSLEILFCYLSALCIINEFSAKPKARWWHKYCPKIRDFSLYMYLCQVVVIRIRPVNLKILALANESKLIGILAFLGMMIVCAQLLSVLASACKRLWKQSGLNLTV